jgi:hypothetical protein
MEPIMCIINFSNRTARSRLSAMCAAGLSTRFAVQFFIGTCLLISGSIAQAQATIDPSQATLFELSVPGLASPSVAKLSPHELVIRDPEGHVTKYLRLPRYDTADATLIGYSSREAQQVIRWPADNSGRMQIGSLQNGKVQFTWSKMTIHASSTNSTSTDPLQPLGSVNEVLPPNVDDPFASRQRGNAYPQGMREPGANSLPAMTAVHLAAGDGADRRFLSMRANNQFGFANQANGMESAWYITPVSNNIVRLQQQVQNNWMAIGLGGNLDNNGMNHRLGNRLLGRANPGNGIGNGNGFGAGSGFRHSNSVFPLSLQPIQNGADQLWRIQNIASGGYCFESVLYPGMGLTCLPNQGLMLQPIDYDPYQLWYPSTPSFALPQPQFRTVQHQVIPNPPLHPATVRIVNSHSDTLMVLIADRRHQARPQKLRIAAGSSESVQLERDAGGTVVQTVEMMDSFGNWGQQQYNTPIPPSVLYDISVYEEFLQSIAIDRTGKSPNPIEDINYQPRSIGFFLVPPGDDLPQLSDMDAYGIAADAQNAGAVRRLTQRDLDLFNQNGPNGVIPATDPLKNLLNQFQKQRGAF